MRQRSSFSANPSTASNKIPSSFNFCEVHYPFGVQNDLGQVVLRGRNFDDHNVNQNTTKCQKVSFPYQRNVGSPSKFSQQSNISRSTSEDTSIDAFELEKAIKENDVIRVRHYLVENREKFQLKEQQSKNCQENENQAQEVTPLLSVETEKADITNANEKSYVYDYSSVSSSTTSLPSSSQISTDLSSSQMPSIIYRNALHVAVAYDASDVVRLLLRYNVDPESKGVYYQSQAFETDNNFNVRLTRNSTCIVENSSHSVADDLLCEEEATGPSSRSDSNNSSTNRIYCPLNILPKSLAPKGITSSSKNVQALAKRASKETVSQQSSKETSPSKLMIKPSTVHIETLTTVQRRYDEKDSGTKISQPELSTDSITMSVPRRVSWVPPNQSPASEAHRRRRMPLKHLSRQRSFSLESHANISTTTTLDTGRKCVSLKSSPQISAHVSTLPSSLSNKPSNYSSSAGVQKQSVTPERSIMAELRRSSEIFKSILLNLSIKENDSVIDIMHSSSSSVTENDVDVDSLWATHKQHCIDNYQFFVESSSSSSTSSTYSSLTSSPDRSTFSTSDLEDCDKVAWPASVVESWHLKTNPNLPPSHLGEMNEVYSRKVLFELPPLIFAVVKGNPIITALLLKYGANVNYQDTFGNTALHLAMCQANIPWECVLDLLENGARICLANHRGIRPVDLTSKPILQRLQSYIVDRCWKIVTEPSQQQQVTSTSAVTAKSAVTPGRILRKLRSNPAESVEEATSCASGGVSSPGSVRSKGSNRSPELSKKDISCVKQKVHEAHRNYKTRRKEWKEAIPRRQDSMHLEKFEEQSDYMFERSLKVLILMSSNVECLGHLIRGFLQNAGKVLNLFQQKNDKVLRRAISAFLHSTLRTGVSSFLQSPAIISDSTQLEHNRREFTALLCLVARICLHLIHSVHGAQYTAMLILNKIIDLSVKHQLTFCKTKISDTLQHPCKIEIETFSNNEQESPSCFSRKGSQSRLEKTFSKRPSFISKSEPTQTKKNEESEECLLDVLTSTHASAVLNTLHNALTLFKRVINSHRTCTPSKRLLHCSYHCLQVLSGRVLLFMTQNEDVQNELLQEQQLRILAATLDLTHDPQLLVLMLQIFANAALHPKNHRILIDHGIPDLLSQLLLPSDDWYYNAHSTKYGLFVKHHVSRVLVYLGFQHRVNHKYSVFDYHIQEEFKEQQKLLEQQPQEQQQVQEQQLQLQRNQNQQLLTQLLFQQLQQQQILEYEKPKSKDSETPKSEKDYITYTSIFPSIVLNDNDLIAGISVENSVYNSLKVIESTVHLPPIPLESSTLHWVLSCNNYHHMTNPGYFPPRKLPNDPNTLLFAQNFVTSFPFVINPIIIIRLLSHRLMTTAPLHRWKSSASRSSFGSIMTHDVPRSPRSRASSTETETSTLRKRRKVNLTLDCANWNNETSSAAVEESSTFMSSNRACRPTPRPSQCRESSISSASGLGIEPTMQAINVFSNILRYAPSRDSIRSTGSCDEHRNYLDSPTNIFPFPALNLHHKARNAFRFSSLKHQNKGRSKSQANISKVERTSSGRETAEQDILAFQKQLQNLPDFDSPDNPSNQILDAALALSEFVSGRALLRPRSRSMPRVTYESSRYLALPDSGVPSRLPRGRSAGTLGFQTELHGAFGQLMLGSPVTTPTDDRRPSGVQPIVMPGAQVITSGNSNSRRSSLSPASDRNNRRRDSPACLQMEIPPRHRAILSFIEEWMRISRTEIERNAPLNRELREFLSKVTTCGTPYQQWCAELRQEFPALNKDPDSEIADDHDSIDREYCQLVKLVISGDLPCNKEEAAVLAGIQLRIEESWGRPQYPTSVSPLPLTPYGDEDLTTLKPISEDKESFLLEVPTFGGHTGGKMIRPVSPLAEDAAENEEETDIIDASKKAATVNTATTTITTTLKNEETPHTKHIANSLLRKCYPSSSNQVSFLPSGGHLEDFLPPYYLGSKCMGKLIKEQKRKLFHTSIYESEIQLKKLYIQTCKRLPAYHCRIFPVKELLRGKTKKRATRLLGLSPQKAVLLDDKKSISKLQVCTDLQQWRSGGGRSHDRLILEFRSVRWSLIVPSTQAMREIGIALWQILQETDTNFLEENASIKNIKQSDNAAKKPVAPIFQPIYTIELESFQKLLHFPEEVALSLTVVENNLFYQVPPIDYLRQVTLDIGGPPTSRSTVRTLVKRFNEVSSWITHLIVMQPTHEDRKAVLSCILRVAVTCWNIGNFSGSMEILAGLKSTKLKPFWLSITEKETQGVPLLDWLTNSLLTPRYEEALASALGIPQCPIVPFFGSFIKELTQLFMKKPSLVVLNPNMQSKELQNLLESLPDLVEEDHYLTIINAGGVMNLEKMYQAQNIMDRIAVFHQHAFNREKQCNNEPLDGIHTPEIERSYTIDESDSIYFQTEMESYKPIQPVIHDHGVCTFPITPACSRLNSHLLQVLHHGTTAVHWDVEGSRSCLIYIRLERSCSMLSWRKPFWSGLKTSPVTSVSDYQLNIRMEDICIPGVPNKPFGEIASVGLEEGFLDLTYVKELYTGAKDKEKEIELIAILKRYALDGNTSDHCCLALLFGANVSDNRMFYLLFPPMVFEIWFEGLCSIVRGLKYQLQMTDRRMIWLREQYIQLYLDEGNFSKPMVMDAIRSFGGRDWSVTGTTAPGISPPENGAIKRGTSIRFRKKRSIGNLPMVPKGELVNKPCDITDLVVNKKCKQTLGSGTYSLPPPSRSRSISSDIDVLKSPHGSGENLEKSSPSRKEKQSDILSQIKNIPSGTITQETQLDFADFVTIFKSFNLRCRKDIRELFDHLAVSGRSVSDSSLTDSNKSSPEHSRKTKLIGLLTRNSSFELEESKNSSAIQKKKIYDAIATASIISNSAGVDTSRSQIITLSNFSKFLETKQFERMTEAEVIKLVHRHEPDSLLRSQNYLSFEGFARYLMDKSNYAYPNERMKPNDNEMDKPLSHYYIASSHNTYLTGHQLKGESSVDLYTHVLLTGCRCVELDCWDGDDGNPLIYHGHTFTTKIPFRAVVEAINKAAFITSVYPVILSLENHCSVQQQNRMAQIFQQVFGEKLVKNFLFEADFSDEPHLPSPSMLKYRILIKNKKLMADITPHPVLKGGRGTQRQPQAPRASSIVSNTSGGSLNDEYSDDEEDDDDDDDDNLDTTTRTDSLSSHETPSRIPTKSSLQLTESEWNGFEDEVIHKCKKQSNQISKELSDIITYIQAIKFRGLNTISPSSSVRYKRTVSSSVSSSMSKKASGTSSPSSSDSHHSKQRVNIYHPCYQCSSLNENAAKKLCRKQPLALIAHTETQLVRTYPAGMRIDSSNFNPVIFWSFGIQMVALNYQTEDTALHINTAMFEQNGRCGFVLKPNVMCDRNHMMYRRFNPWDKEFDGLHSSNFILNVISGQYLSQNTFTASVQVEVELIGIPVDSCKQKTKIVQRNSLNPMWNDTFFFQVMFRDLTFIRFNVIDVSTNHIIAQRVVPLKNLRPGYRHVRLRNNQNQPLYLSTLFIYSRTEEESLDYSASENSFPKEGISSTMEASGTLGKPDARCPGVKRRMFFLMVYGVVPDESSTILKITQESTTQEVILQALQKASLGSEKINDYVLVEEVSRGWEKKDREVPATQRVLDPQECPLQAQAQWQGEGRFLLKRLGDDPSSRAWLSSIRSTRIRQPKTWEDADNFLVCVYNVSADIPYAILKVPVSACAQDVLAQALIKARRLENPSQFLLIEELEYGGNKQQRVLADDENVYSTQAHWPTIGRFILYERDAVKKVKSTAFEKLSKGLSKLPVGEALSDPPTSRFMKTRFPLSGPGRGGSAKENVVASTEPTSKKHREVHSEGEAISDEDKDQDFISTMSRLKQLSIRKFRAWKS